MLQRQLPAMWRRFVCGGGGGRSFIIPPITKNCSLPWAPDAFPIPDMLLPSGAPSNPIVPEMKSGKGEKREIVNWVSRKKLVSPVLVQLNSPTEKCPSPIQLNPILVINWTLNSIRGKIVKWSRKVGKLTRILFGVVTILLKLGWGFGVELRCRHWAGLKGRCLSCVWLK